MKAPKKKIKYDLKSMRKAVVKCDENIGIFENAIVKEQETKRFYQSIVRRLEEELDSAD